MLKNILLGLSAIIIFLFCCDRLLSLTDIDMSLLRKTLYYQGVDLEVHRVSDKGMLYELKPGASFKYTQGVHEKETKYSQRVVTINSLGFRDREREKVKKDKIFRIIVLGASNTYGAAVSNDDTYTAQMQKIFDAKYPGRVEVWNMGVSAYVMSQLITSAEYAMKNFSPDLLIFQDSNWGRRPFLLFSTVKELKVLFKKDPELYCENMPLLLHNPNQWEKKFHYFLITRSPLYRISCLCLYIRLGVFDKEQLMHRPGVVPNQNERSHNLLLEYGATISKREFNAFIKRYSRMPIIVFSPTIDNCSVQCSQIKGNAKFIWFNHEGQPAEYSFIHPPSYVYAWYAQRLCDFLMRAGYLNFR